VLATLVLFLAVRVGLMLATCNGRRKLWAMMSKLWRWEFWPGWLFYLPMAPWWIWLAIRHRGATTFTAAVPALPHGGVVGESKWQILQMLPEDRVLPAAVIEPGDPAQRTEQLAHAIEQRNWTFPLILKPDVGYRGRSVRKIESLDEAFEYFDEAYPDRVIAQVYHPGPYEAGVFFYRYPGSGCRILAITDKHFPRLVGDGASTIKQLIYRDRRFRMQAGVFLARFRERQDQVLESGVELPLVVAGNHCQGTRFTDGSHLATPELEAAIDQVMREVEGFDIGRFDLRYGDVEALKRGEGFAIVELNGVSSEATNIYDPSWPIWRAYRVLMRQWAITFRIGARNRALGHPTSSPWALLRDVWRHFRRHRLGKLAD